MSKCSDHLWKIVKEISEKYSLDIEDSGWEGDHDLSNFSAEDLSAGFSAPRGKARYPK